MDAFSDPESLCDRTELPFREEIQRLPQEEFESVTERVDSHAVIWGNQRKRRGAVDG